MNFYRNCFTTTWYIDWNITMSLNLLAVWWCVTKCLEKGDHDDFLTFGWDGNNENILIQQILSIQKNIWNYSSGSSWSWGVAPWRGRPRCTGLGFCHRICWYLLLQHSPLLLPPIDQLDVEENLVICSTFALPPWFDLI